MRDFILQDYRNPALFAYVTALGDKLYVNSYEKEPYFTTHETDLILDTFFYDALKSYKSVRHLIKFAEEHQFQEPFVCLAEQHQTFDFCSSCDPEFYSCCAKYTLFQKIGFSELPPTVNTDNKTVADGEQVGIVESEGEALLKSKSYLKCKIDDPENYRHGVAYAPVDYAQCDICDCQIMDFGGCGCGDWGV